MRKLVLGLAMVVTVMGLVGCGTEDKGFTPDQVTETPNGTENVLNDDVKEDIEEIANGDLTQYYDTEKIIGTPKLETWKVKYWGGITQINRYIDNGHFPIVIEDNGKLEDGKTYKCIICDNNTPDDYTDDVVAYIFTTPID